MLQINNNFQNYTLILIEKYNGGALVIATLWRFLTVS